MDKPKSVFGKEFFIALVITALAVPAIIVISILINMPGLAFSPVVVPIGAWLVALAIGIGYLRQGKRQRGAGIIVGLALATVIGGVSCFALLSNLG